MGATSDVSGRRRFKRSSHVAPRSDGRQTRRASIVSLLIQLDGGEPIPRLGGLCAACPAAACTPTHAGATCVPSSWITASWRRPQQGWSYAEDRSLPQVRAHMGQGDRGEAWDAAAQGHPAFYTIAEQREMQAAQIQHQAKRVAFIKYGEGEVHQVHAPFFPDPSCDRNRLAAIEEHYLSACFRPAPAEDVTIPRNAPIFEAASPLRRVKVA